MSFLLQEKKASQSHGLLCLMHPDMSIPYVVGGISSVVCPAQLPSKGPSLGAAFQCRL